MLMCIGLMSVNSIAARDDTVIITPNPNNPPVVVPDNQPVIPEPEPEPEPDWDEKTRTVIIEDLLFKVEIPIDTNKIIVNGQNYTSDVKPEILDDRTMMPIANIARALGLKDGEDIFWDKATKQVIIIRTISR